MPTKRNYAGNQQNYVEVGHGDQSGEYRAGPDGAFNGAKKEKDETGFKSKVEDYLHDEEMKKHGKDMTEPNENKIPNKKNNNSMTKEEKMKVILNNNPIKNPIKGGGKK